MYEVFGFMYEMKLLMCLEGYLGELEVWDKAEAAFKFALDRSGREWKLNEGDGVFYGLKIDIIVFDVFKCCF